MSRIILCMGQYATKPYRIDSNALWVYSIEELCYFLCDNMLFLDKDMMNKELPAWIEEECALPKLAQKLRECIRKKEPLQTFVTTILEGAHYAEKQELAEIAKQIAESAALDSYGKRKGRTDLALKDGNYLTVLQDYEKLRLELHDDEMLLYSKITHNMGVLYARLYCFERAAAYFKEAFEKGGNTESYEAYLAAKRMLLKEEEYVDFIAKEPQALQESLHLENRIENTEGLWERTEAKKGLEELDVWKKGNKAADYYESIEQRANDLKDKYRSHVLHL